MAKGKKSKSEAENSLVHQEPPPTIVEWIVRGVSFLIIFSLLGYFIFKAVQPPVEPKFSFDVKQEKIAERNGVWVVPVGIKNEGSTSVHELRVTGTMTLAGGEEQENVSIPILGAGEVVVAEFWFDNNPQGNDMKFDLGTYIVP